MSSSSLSTLGRDIYFRLNLHKGPVDSKIRVSRTHTPSELIRLVSLKRRCLR